MKDVKATIVRIIAEYLDKDEAEVSTSASFTEIGLDSLDIMIGSILTFPSFEKL